MDPRRADHDRPRRHLHDAEAAAADRGRAARPDGVRDAPLRARRDDGGVRRLRRRADDERAQGRARARTRFTSSRPARRERSLRAREKLDATRCACLDDDAITRTTVDVILRDGSTLRLRPPRSGRRRRPRSTSSASSPSAASTFASTASRRSTSASSSRCSIPTGRSAARSLGTLADEDGERVVAVANYVRLRDPLLAEVAFAVADAHQARGIGTRLLEQLAARAAESGSSASSPRCWPDNRADARRLRGGRLRAHPRARRAARSRCSSRSRRRASYDARVDERDHARGRPPRCDPSSRRASVAVSGASRRRGSIGGELFRNILDGDFAGAAYPVNRDGEPVAGVRAYSSVEEIPEPVDLAVICASRRPRCSRRSSRRSAPECAALCRDLGRLRRGRRRGRSSGRSVLLALVRAHGARLIGPNCLGIASAAPSLNATFALARAPAREHRLLVAERRARARAARGGGVARPRPVGVRLDRQQGRRLLERPARVVGGRRLATALVLLYLESFGNPRRFGRLARRVARTKPILALKSGTRAPRAAGGELAHGGARRLRGGRRRALPPGGRDPRGHARGAHRRGGAALDAAEPAGRRVAVLTNAGGLGILCADACEAAGLELAAARARDRRALAASLPGRGERRQSRSTCSAARPPATYADVVPLVLADPRVDALIVLFVPTVARRPRRWHVALEGRAGRQPDDKPVLAVVMSAEGIPAPLRARSRHVAAFAYPESAARALGRAAERADWLRRPLGGTVELEGDRPTPRERVVERALAETRRRAGSRPRGARAPARLRDPARRRSGSRRRGRGGRCGRRARLSGRRQDCGCRAPTRPRLGGIALDLADDEAVRAAVERIGAPVLVQPMVTGGAELLAGVVQDPVFGPLVAFGPGGVLAELIGRGRLPDRAAHGRRRRGARHGAARPAGSCAASAARLRRTPPRSSTSSSGSRGSATTFPPSPSSTSTRCSALPDGCVAVDARVRVQRAELARRAKSW